MRELKTHLRKQTYTFPPAILTAALLLSACATYLKPHPQPVSFALSSDPASEAWKPLHSHLPADRATSWFDIQDIGPEALRWRLALIDTATISINNRILIPRSAACNTRSMILNTEASLMIDSPELAAAILTAFATDFSPNNSWRVELSGEGGMSWHSSDGVLTRQPAGSIWRRMGDVFYGLMPIDQAM
jgi:hypothetical protein